MTGTLRTLTVEDLDRAMPLIEAFARFSTPGAPFHPGSATAFWTMVLERSAGTLIGADVDGALVGVIGLSLRPDPYSNRLGAFEMLWWLTPEARATRIGLLLLDAAETWARTNHVLDLTFGRFMDEESARLDTVYRRRGFTPYGIGYRKELTYV